MAYKTYTVTAALIHPSCFHTGFEYEIHAKTKADAIKQARRRVYDDGHTRQDGGLRFSAVETD